MAPFGKFDERISTENLDAKIVWRYVDLAKFMDLFVKRRIYFRRSDLFDDVYEGMPTTPLLKDVKANFQSVHKAVPGIWKNSAAAAKKSLLELRERNFINSWYLSDYESAAMWSLYSKIGSGIAIRSTVKRLRDAIPDAVHPDIYIGRILYVDYKDAKIDNSHDLRSQFFLKRNHFEHEREIRVLYSAKNRDPKKEGHYIENIDLDVMIDKIVLAPKTADWFEESIKAFLSSVGCAKEVVPSALETKPPIMARRRPKKPK